MSCDLGRNSAASSSDAWCSHPRCRVIESYEWCPKCEIFVSKLPASPYDSSYYYARRFRRSPASLARAELLWHLFADSLAGQSLLDFGCNDGAFVSLAAGKVTRAVGVDINTEILEFARQQGGGEFLQPENVTDRFDAVVAFDVIEHFDSPADFFNSVERFVKKNGRLIITTPNANSKWRKIYGEGWHGFGIPRYHRVLLSRRRLAELLQNANYRLEKMFTTAPIEKPSWRLLIASGYRCDKRKMIKIARLPSSIAKFAVGKIMGGEEDTLCLVAQRT